MEKSKKLELDRALQQQKELSVVRIEGLMGELQKLKAELAQREKEVVELRRVGEERGGDVEQ